jgi:hypothetical protein
VIVSKSIRHAIDLWLRGLRLRPFSPPVRHPPTKKQRVWSERRKLGSVNRPEGAGEDVLEWPGAFPHWLATRTELAECGRRIPAHPGSDHQFYGRYTRRNWRQEWQ